MKGSEIGQDRKELLRKEYNRVIETRLPNIYTMMSQFNEGNPSSLRADTVANKFQNGSNTVEEENRGKNSQVRG